MVEKCGTWTAGILTIVGIGLLLVAAGVVGLAAWPDKGVRP